MMQAVCVDDKLTEEIVAEYEGEVCAYMDGVLNGEILACEYLKLAVKRQIDDLENGGERGLVFERWEAAYVIKFFGLLKHSKGKWAGSPFILEPWQKFIVWVVFGWKNPDGTRRFRTVYKEVARKNGKSTFLAALGLYGLGFDDENGSEVYSVATKEDQARITHNEGRSMAKKSGYLGGLATIHKKAISVDSRDSTWIPLGSNSTKQDGFNPHMVLVDELHAHPDRTMIDVMDSGLGSREQPLLFIVTTAGFNVQSVCYYERDYAIKVLKGDVEDDTYFAIIFTLDRDEVSGELLDDWKDPKVWIKANPNLGVSVYLNDMERMCKKAIESPLTLNNFLTKKLDVWTTQETKYFNMEKWNACNEVIDESELLGRRCFLGIDLASKNDIGALVSLFELEDKRVVVLCKFYCPRERAIERSKKDRVPYMLWADQGYLILTKGNRINYDIIKKDIEIIHGKFDVLKTGFDQWNFEYLFQRLVSDGMDAENFVQYGQTLKNMSEPTKDLDVLVVEGRFVHNNNPILKWMASNTAVYTDPNDNVRPVKNKSSEKIDGIVATVMARGLSLIEPPEEESVYETRGILEL
jgi:phage terminase large subunit-like protein